MPSTTAIEPVAASVQQREVGAAKACSPQQPVLRQNDGMGRPERFPRRPMCKGVKVTSPGKGRPCRRRALADSEYCYSHDPRRALERQATSSRMRARVGSETSAAPRVATRALELAA
jgi:hypothetical protein